jgi:spore coat protein U-like protein
MHNIQSYKNILALFFCLIPLYASSQSTTEANLQVTATVQAACQISTEPLNFGNYDPLSNNDLNAQGAVVMNCVAGVAPKIYLGRGINFKDGDRQMLGSNGELLKYKIFQPDSTLSGQGCTSKITEWKDSGNNRLITTASTITGTKKYAVCGVIPKNQSPTEGTYSDTVVARFDFLP